MNNAHTEDSAVSLMGTYLLDTSGPLLHGYDRKSVGTRLINTHMVRGKL